MIFIYLILLVVSVFFYILYEGVISLMLICSLILLPAILLLLNLYAASRVSVDLRIDDRSCTAGQSIPISIYINNRSIIPIPCAEILMEYTVSSSNESERIKINTPVFPSNIQKMSTYFSSEHFGMVSCRIVRIRLYDMLRLTRLRVSHRRINGQSGSVMVLPEAIELSNTVSDYSDLGLESDVYSPDKPGDDPSEIFALREYADGDKMARIHWKLTAKTDRLMVKDYSLPLADSFLILTDTYIPAGESSADIYDMLVELTFSLSSLLQEKERRHRIACYSEAAGELTELAVTDDASLLDAAAALLHCGTAERQDLTAAAAAASDAPVRHYGHLILVCAAVSEKTSSVLLSSGLANRYTILLCRTDDQPAADIRSGDIDIITVERGRIEESIADLIL